MAIMPATLRKRLRRQAALIGKEATQTLRDRRTLTIVLALPLVELFLLGYAVHLTVQHLPTVVADLSKDDQSRAFIDAMVNSKYFDIAGEVGSQAEVVAAIDEGRAKAGFVIPPDFAAQVARGEAQALVILDGSDSFSVSSGYSAAVSVGQERALALAQDQASRLGVDLEAQPITTLTQVLYNPSQNDLIFIMPGLIAVVVQLMAVQTTAQSVVREYELGTMEQLMATAARPLEIVIGKLVPAMVLMFLDVAITTVIGVFWFGVPFRGNPFAFAGLAVLFVSSGLGLGLLVSSIARTQKEAQQVTVLVSLVSMLLSGFIYPRGPMPAAIRLVGNVIPVTYFLRLARGLITKGVGVSLMWPDAIALVIYGVVITSFAALTTRKRLG
jgi:ABC-2 type transport system permease protein